jgi:PBP1b-binding outer membrane lipoprotein LpoB
MNKPTLLRLSLVLGSAGILLFSGCASNEARRIDPQGTETITTVDQLDIQDATDAAGELSASLLASGVLGQEGRPSIIAISNYVNRTGIQLDRDRIVKKIRVSLNKAGVAQTITTIGATGTAQGAEDTLATNRQQINQFLSDDEDAPKVEPEYSLTFKALRQRARAGSTRQNTFIFQMSLTEIATGLAVWEDEKMITKQGDKPAVGW